MKKGSKVTEVNELISGNSLSTMFLIRWVNQKGKWLQEKNFKTMCTTLLTKTLIINYTASIILNYNPMSS